MLLPPESRGRVQKAAIVPLTVLQPALKQFGRTDATVAILLACGKLDKQWRMAIEDEANAAEGLVDLELKDALETEEMDEKAAMDLGHELLTQPLPYDAEPEDEAKVANTALAPVPALVTQQLREYAAWRTDEFNASRTAVQVVDTTVESDSSTALRFLGYLKQTEGQTHPSIKLFAHPNLGQWTERYLKWLKNDLGLKSSTLAVYCNSVLSVATYALTLVSETERNAVPLEQLVNLRKQAESISKQEKLFEVKSKHWLSWEQAQEARVHAFEQYAQAKEDGVPLAERSRLLRDCLVLAFHTLQPPDRPPVAIEPHDSPLPHATTASPTRRHSVSHTPSQASVSCAASASASACTRRRARRTTRSISAR